MNQVTLLGFVGQDPELRETREGTQVCNFQLATSIKWTDRNGEKRERTEWHKCRAWRNIAKRCSNIRKGDRVMIVGELRTEEYEYNCKCGERIVKHFTYIDIQLFSISVKIDTFYPQEKNGNQENNENLPF